jgi:hypothetical protein
MQHVEVILNRVAGVGAPMGPLSKSVSPCAVETSIKTLARIIMKDQGLTETVNIVFIIN